MAAIATMAPALTEATTQAKIKLPETSTTSTAASSDTVNRHNISRQTHKQVLGGTHPRDSTKSVHSNGTAVVSGCVHLNRGSQCNEDTQSSALGQPTRFKSAQNGKDLITDRHNCINSFQDEFLKTIKHLYAARLGRLPQIMNQPSTSPGKEEGKCCGQHGKNVSHIPPLSEVGQTVVGNSSRDLRANQPLQRPTSGQSFPQERSNTNMCKEQEMGGPVGTPNPKTNRTCSGPFQGSNDVDRNTPKSGQYHAYVSSSPESICEGERVDEELQNVHGEASKKQAQLERRFEFLMRRLRRLQAHQVEQHIKHQFDNYVAHHRNLQTVAKTIGPTQMNENSCDLKKELSSDGVKSLSTRALVTLVKKMQQASNSIQQQTQTEDVCKATAEKLAMHLRFMQFALDSDATESSSGGESGDDDGPGVQLTVPPTPLVRRAEWKWLSERSAVASRWTWLQAQVSDLEYRIRQQSEKYKQARLSKGPVLLGEPPPPQDFLRVSSQPSAGVSGEARTASAVTGTEVSPLPVSALLSNMDKQASRLTQSLGNCLTPVNTSPASSVGSSRPKSGVTSPAATPNGLIDSPLSTASLVDVEGGSPPSLSADSQLAIDLVDLSPVLDPSCQASRCLPLKHPLRKRKLLRTSGLHLRSAKAARLSSVKCRCHGSVMPCVLCSGRAGIMQTIDANSMPHQERVALLDHCYHHVLSFHEDVPLSVRFEALLWSGNWQNKTQTVRRPRAETGQRRQKYPPNLTDGRKKPFRKNAAAVIIQSAKIRNKYEQKTCRKPGPPRGKRLGKRALNAELKRRKNNTALGSEVKRKSLMDYQGSGFDTPAASPLSRDTLLSSMGVPPKEKEVRKRRGESPYDINNIVIPHSIACLTRVEKLEYKEIPIPSWRDLTEEEEEEERVPVEEPKVPPHKSNGLLTSQEEMVDDEVEDLSDEVFILRHNRCEVEEKKHFSSFLRFPTTRRHRLHPHLLYGQEKEQSPGGGSVVSTPVSSRPLTPSLPAVSMGTQVSLDSSAGELTGMGEDSLDYSSGRRGSVSLPQTPRSSTPIPRFTLSEDDSFGLNVSGSGGGGNVLGSGLPMSHRGSVSAGSQLEHLSLGSSQEEMTTTPPDQDRDPAVMPWHPREFPLSDEEVTQLNAVVGEGTPAPHHKAQRSLQAVSGITTLRPQPVDGASQAGSSLSGSLPPSPLPSTTSSMSAAGEADATDPEWMEDSGSRKHGSSSQQKTAKR